MKSILKEFTTMKRNFALLLLTFSCLFAAGQEYKKLHFDAILVDTHNDIPSASIEKKVQFETDLKGKKATPHSCA